MVAGKNLSFALAQSYSSPFLCNCVNMGAGLLTVTTFEVWRSLLSVLITHTHTHTHTHTRTHTHPRPGLCQGLLLPWDLPSSLTDGLDQRFSWDEREMDDSI